MTILIIGGTGLMGPDVVTQLHAAGHSTICVNRRGLHPAVGRALSLDRADSAALASAIRATAPDLVIDMIPFTEEHAIGLADILRETRTPLVACSSGDVYRAFNIMHRVESPPYQPCPIKETDALRDRLSPKGKGYDKLHVERRYMDLPGDVTILRMPAIYGWPDTYRVRETVDEILSTGEVRLHPAFARWKFCRSFNRNCAHAVCLAVGKPGKRIYNVAEPTASTEEEWARRIGEALDWSGPIIMDESRPILFGMDVAQHLDTDSRLIRAELGYREIVDPKLAVRETVQAYLRSKARA